MIARDEIVAAARAWVGTPYHHQASMKGVGCDCLGLIRGIWRELVAGEPEALPAYARDWGDATGAELLMEAGCRHLIRLDDITQAAPGDVLAFRMQAGVTKHAGVLSAGYSEARSALLERQESIEALSRSALLERQTFIHAREEIGVVEVTLTRWWRRRVVAAFSFPGVA